MPDAVTPQAHQDTVTANETILNQMQLSIGPSVGSKSKPSICKRAIEVVKRAAAATRNLGLKTGLSSKPVGNYDTAIIRLGVGHYGIYDKTDLLPSLLSGKSCDIICAMTNT